MSISRPALICLVSVNHLLVVLCTAKTHDCRIEYLMNRKRGLLLDVQISRQREPIVGARMHSFLWETSGLWLSCKLPSHVSSGRKLQSCTYHAISGSSCNGRFIRRGFCCHQSYRHAQKQAWLGAMSMTLPCLNAFLRCCQQCGLCEPVQLAYPPTVVLDSELCLYHKFAIHQEDLPVTKVSNSEATVPQNHQRSKSAQCCF